MKPRVLLSALALLASLAALPAPAVAGTETIEIEGREIIIESPDWLGTSPAPIVFLLHGAFGTAKEMADRIPLARLADEGGFRAVYIDGSRLMRLKGGNWKAWNAGYCCGRAFADNVDDLGTLDRIIARFEAAGLLQPGRVYLVGHSNGAMMSYHYACNRPGVIAGVVGLAGNYVAQSCPGARGLQVLEIHGAKDEVISIDYGLSQVLGAVHTSLDGFARFMREEGAEMQVILLPDAAHPLEDIELKVARHTGLGLNATVARFVVTGGHEDAPVLPTPAEVPKVETPPVEVLPLLPEPGAPVPEPIEVQPLPPSSP
ncbi:alpha/beta hydrolase family esterase [Frigidibacter sp. ROC022]|uniref:alpha/beta hydrolase family esterase n=1 Tax=Frigidibacter sp. ROC022 TaxID=2971796 RepID=UPI00215A3614|nr:PHB depolymerase family esterase [Frigidibacter sp. ROC022]MCR8723741.1 hypothetical protein [Frigidibacter sp. ROC022]